MSVAPSPTPALEPQRSPVANDAAQLLYERYSDRVLSYCLYALRSREDAEDALQTTFLHAFRALQRGVTPAAEGAWLLTIARNVCLSRHRSVAAQKRAHAVQDLDALQDSLAAPERNGDDVDALRAALADMPDAQRRAILLREWQGLSYREVAAELGLSQAATEALIFRARRTLARSLADAGALRQRVKGALDLGSLAGALKAALGGASAVKLAAVAAAIAIGAVATGGLVVRSLAPDPPARSAAQAPRPEPATAEAPMSAPRDLARERATQGPAVEPMRATPKTAQKSAGNDESAGDTTEAAGPGAETGTAGDLLEGDTGVLDAGTAGTDVLDAGTDVLDAATDVLDVDTETATDLLDSTTDALPGTSVTTDPISDLSDATTTVLPDAELPDAPALPTAPTLG